MVEDRLVIETEFYTRPLGHDPLPEVPARQPGENPAEARRRRAKQFAIGKRQKDATRLGGQQVASWSVPVTLLSISGMRDPTGIPRPWQHACCALPDEVGRVYPVCGMSAMDCAGYDWF